jgi:acetyl-CoA synthetase
MSKNQTTHLTQTLQELNIPTLEKFHRWTVDHHDEFVKYCLTKLKIVFQKQPKSICDLSKGVESPRWFPDAKMNIAESCFNASPEKIAIICQHPDGHIKKITYDELNRLSNRIANSLIQKGFKQGDAIAIDMPMHEFAVAIYLGIIKMGGVVVSIADSFSKDEIATRLKIANTKAIFTQDFILRAQKKLPLYEKVVSANSPQAIVITVSEEIPLRENDISWKNFLVDDEKFISAAREPMQHCNILFSSGTTGTPKAIPWNHTTGIKSASDAYFHQDVQQDDVFAWPTNLGWMMGPWLIFATLINQATIALYDGIPREAAFGKFIQDAHVTILGVVPTLVAYWRQTKCMEKWDWHRIKLFTSTGECSNPEDMSYLSKLAGNKPIIEYCGGTEIGGAYITSTLIEKNEPSIFTTPAMGIDFTIIDENGNTTDNGEVALISPALGLSTELLNADHHEIYYANMPTYQEKKLRRHGDQIIRLNPEKYSLLGRIDDTMNLGGIKVSSAEIERVLAGIGDIQETAAIAVSPQGHGPSQLVIYAATQKNLNKNNVKEHMQSRINQHLNPLFKIYDIIFIPELPKTASNKIMRRVLRNQYQRGNV